MERHNDVAAKRAPSPLMVALALAAVYLFWGGTYLGMKIAIETMPPFLMAGVRFSVAGGVLYLLRRVSGDARPTWPEWKNAGIVGALLLLGGNGVVAWAEQMVPSSIASLLVATAPLWMAAIGHYTKRTELNAGAMVGLIVGFAGIGILVWTNKNSEASQINPVGIAALLFASVSWAAGSMFSRQAKLPSSPLLSTGMQMIVGGVLLLVLSLVLGDFRSFDLAKVSLRSYLALGYLIVCGSIIGFTSYIWLFKNAETTLVSTYAFVNPIVAVFLGWLIAGERIGANTLVAAAVIIAAVVVITVSRKPGKG